MSMKKKVFIYDTTLRDGAQAEGVTFSPISKLHVAKMLDSFGVDYIEGGYAASNPRDMAFFRDIKKENLKHAKVAAFGSTRRAGVRVEEDKGALALLEADTQVCTIFGKSWLLHVTEVLKTTAAENLAMIEDTCRFLKENGKEVVYDAEHFSTATTIIRSMPCRPSRPPWREGPMSWCSVIPTGDACRMKYTKPRGGWPRRGCRLRRGEILGRR